MQTLICSLPISCSKGTKPEKIAPPGPPGLIYHIPFNEGKGSTAAVFGSKGGAEPTATLVRGASWDVGSHGAALKLDGHKHYALGPEIKGNPALKDLTGCIWAKFASTSSGGARQYMIDSEPHNYILLVDQVSSGKIVKVRPIAQGLRD